MVLDKRALGVVFAAMSAFLQLYGTQALLPLLSREFQASPSAVSRTVSAATFAVALIAPFTGVVADTFGRKRIIVGAMFLLAIPTALAATAPDLGTLVLWRFCQGLLMPPIFAVTVAYIGEEMPENAVAMTGLYVAATGVGGFLSRFISGLLAEHLGWRAAFVGLALLALLFAVGGALFLPAERRFRRSGGIVASLGMMAAHLQNHQLVATYAVGFGVLFSFVATFTYINFVLAAPPYSFSSAALGAIFIVYLVGVVLPPFTERFVRRFGRRRLVAGVSVFWLVGLALTLLPSFAAIIAGLALSVSAGFMCQSCATSYVAVTARQARSSAVGLYVTFYYIGGGVGTTLAGYGFEFAGWPGCVATVAVVVVLVASLAWRFWREEERAV